jgi:glycogen debranching enzyme
MTLFGRDSILTALMLLPFDPAVGLTTARVLARLQGTRDDDETEEQPGKIVHEARPSHDVSLAFDDAHLYYGSVDATLLFVLLVHELWLWGTPFDVLRPLLPHVDAALGWAAGPGDPDGDGYVEYQRRTPSGLANQGWKDSADAVRFADGRLARAPIAMCEVQGYVYAALVARSHFATENDDTELADQLRARAEALKAAFNRDFWLEEQGFFAMALDADKAPVDGLASNMGHCLWTGIVDEDKAPLVAKHLVSDPGLWCGWGVRTLAETVKGYNPISYHCGSVWPHDNAIAAAGLMRYGFVDEAHQVMEGMIAAAPFFDNRLPELFAGLSRSQFQFPVSYPTSCSPQAWAAAAPLLFLRTMLRFEPDIRNATLHLTPRVPEWIGALALEQVPLMGGHLSIRVEADHLDLRQVPDGLTVVHEPRQATF